MKKAATILASWVAERPGKLLALAAVLAAVSVAVLATGRTFDTDILNLLPAGRSAVEGLKTYNSEFTQTKELAFLLTWLRPPDDIDRAREEFVALLKQQPWAARILDTPPTEAVPEGGSTNEIVVPLLLNLPTKDFAEALAQLNPQVLNPRLARLAQQMADGSPKARIELMADPLGWATRAARPVWETISMSDTFDLTAPDNTALLVPVVTNQPDASAAACQRLMAEVHQFIAEARTKLGPDAPEIGVTGRSAYVDEIAHSMQRDIAVTSTVSLLAVAALFWLGFRRIAPLVGITLILGLTAVVTMAVGVVVFHELNIIAISFCSILFGLGDDFSLLLCQHYFQALAAGSPRKAAIKESIAHCLPGMIWVAVTTGVGFLALLFSGSAGFAQLGFLVAVGVIICAIFMPLFLFPFLNAAPPEDAVRTGPAAWLAGASARHPRRLLAGSGGMFAILLVLLFLPGHKLGFDLSSNSLEPKNTPAARTLARIMEKFPSTFEPIIVVLPNPTLEGLRSFNEALNDLKKAGLIETFSSPSGLYLDPQRAQENRAQLQRVDWPAAREGWKNATAAAGLRELPSGIGLIDAMEKEAKRDQPTAWKDFLLADSQWWFLIDRMVAPSSPALLAYLKVPKGWPTEKREAIEQSIRQAVPDAMVTGWSQSLASLVPWAHRELAIFGSLVAVIVLTLLAVVYRNGWLWALHALALIGALAGTAVTLQICRLSINLLDVLAFPLMLGVGVDYGTHLILAARDGQQNLAGTLKAVTLSGLTTSTGFGALMLAQNPALSGLGAICGIGVLWCLLSSLFIVVPGAGMILRGRDFPIAQTGAGG